MCTGSNFVLGSTDKLGNFTDCMLYIIASIGLTAVRDRRKVGSVSLDEHTVKRNRLCASLNDRSVFIGDNPRKGNIPSAAYEILCHFGASRITMKNSANLRVTKYYCLKAVAVRLAVVDDYGNVIFLCKSELCFKELSLLFLIILTPMIVESDLAKRDDLVLFSLIKQRSKICYCCFKGILLVDVGRVDTDGGIQSFVLRCHFNGFKAVCGVGAHVYNLINTIGKNGREQRRSAALELLFKPTVVIMRV